MTFVPKLREREQSPPTQGKSLREILSAELAKDSQPSRAAILDEWGDNAQFPRRLVVVVGPGGATPHAVAFLITLQSETDEPACYYANTGLGAKWCGASVIQTTRRWNGATIIPLIEYARRTVFNKEQFDEYVEFLENSPDYDRKCVRWDASVTDRMVTH